MSGLYGIKDMSDIFLIDKATGLPALSIPYANSANLDVTSEAVTAKVRGTDEITWDSNKNATFNISSEVFEMGYLAMQLGSEIKEGQHDVFRRVEGIINNSKAVNIGVGEEILPQTISVVRLEAPGSVVHSGLPLHNGSASMLKLPAQVHNVTISANDTTAKIKFQDASGADKYVILRDDSVVAETASNEYTDTGLTAETVYKYKVYGINSHGKGPASAEVEVTAATVGTLDYTQYLATELALTAAVDNIGEVEAPVGGVTYTYSKGVITFNERATNGDAYAVYFAEKTDGVQKIEIDADKFSGMYEIYANAMARTNSNGKDDLMQFHFFKAKPQSNFTLEINSEAPSTLSVTFNLMPERIGERSGLADILVIP